MTAPATPAVAEVVAAHRPDGGAPGPGAICVACTPGFGTRHEDPVPWPCPTLTTATATEEATHP